MRRLFSFSRDLSMKCVLRDSCTIFVSWTVSTYPKFRAGSVCSSGPLLALHTLQNQLSVTVFSISKFTSLQNSTALYCSSNWWFITSIAARSVSLPHKYVFNYFTFSIPISITVNSIHYPSFHRHPRIAPTKASELNSLWFRRDSRGKPPLRLPLSANFCRSTNVPWSIIIKFNTAPKHFVSTGYTNNSLD
jgi:hypothetical protein